MRIFQRPFRRYLLVGLALAGVLTSSGAWAEQIRLKDQRILKGRTVPLASVGDLEKIRSVDGPLQLIQVVDDDLRRTFVSRRAIQDVFQDDPGDTPEIFRINQKVLHNGQEVRTVGSIVRVEPFNEFGRRIFTMQGPRGPIDIVQGITQITPQWTKVEGQNYVWDMRMATSSIPPDILAQVLHKQIHLQDIEQRKKIARFYLQSERYEEAEAELQKIQADFAGQEGIEEQMAPSIQRLRQLAAGRLLQELQLRRKAGQHAMVLALLQKFPSEGVAGELLQAVREMVEEYAGLENDRKQMLLQFESLLAEVSDASVRERIEPIRREIAAELSGNTLDRMAAFKQAADDADLLPGEKLALAASGWLVGSDAATQNLPVALSLFRTRALVRQYLNEPDQARREQILAELVKEEGATPALVSEILGRMKPPVETPPEAFDPEHAGCAALEVTALSNEPPVPYVVQLPPEYDPLRRYPAIVTLHGGATTPMQQIDWWAGAWTEKGLRAGQATRQGYIVIAPAWTEKNQAEYGFSAREHFAVLNSLRDACRRFSIDTDRVFLTGHSMGGDAAWDIGLAHPDLWAGVIPIVASSEKYCSLYSENARLLPLYFVCGERDGGKMSFNSRDFDRYLQKGFPCTVVEYLGRGHEDFYDEIFRLFDWMERQQRDFFPKEFECSAMRPWDNAFWWVTISDLPRGSTVFPEEWPPSRGTLPVAIKGKATETNGMYVQTGAGTVTIGLSPRMLDFERRISVTVNGKRLNTIDVSTDPDLKTLLEDVRTRCDRQNPFWAKVEMVTGRSLPSR